MEVQTHCSTGKDAADIHQFSKHVLQVMMAIDSSVPVILKN